MTSERNILAPDGRGVRRASEVAPAIGIALTTLLRAVERGEVKGTRVGRQTLIPLHEVARLLGRPLVGGEHLVPAGDAELLSA